MQRARRAPVPNGVRRARPGPVRAAPVPPMVQDVRRPEIIAETIDRRAPIPSRIAAWAWMVMEATIDHMPG